MKLHLDKSDQYNTIARYDHQHIMVGPERHTSSVIVLPDRVETNWLPGGFESLDEACFERLAALGCEIVLLGTGSKQRFPHPRLMRPLMEARIGIEVMNLGSACRTYNVLVAEHRQVAAALFFDPATQS
jgi:uncharacterized protein